jgi:hypothetical protein
MSNAIDALENDPEPHEPGSGSPAVKDRDQKTPEAEQDESGVESQKSNLAIGGDQSSQESGRRKRLPQSANVFLHGMSSLGRHKGAERCLNSRHRPCV